MKNSVKVIAVLDTMWDCRNQTGDMGHRKSPKYFHINRENHSGKRLYKLIGSDVQLLVTNSCRELTSHANKHGTPDSYWLSDNLTILCESSHVSLILLCGKVAQKTYAESGWVPCHEKVLEIMHPAARTWTKELIEEKQTLIRKRLRA